MLSVKEILDKTQRQRRLIEATMDSWGQYHPAIDTPEHTTSSLYDGLSIADAYAIQQTLRATPLREFLIKSGTTGLAGAAYIVPAKVHEDLIYFAKEADYAPLIGSMVNGWEGGDLNVNITDDESYIAHDFAGGGAVPTSTVKSEQATLAPRSFGIDAQITNTLIEDAAFDVVEYHLQKAAVAMAEKSNYHALTALKTATDGVGSVNGGASGDADETKWTGASTTGVDTCLAALSDDNWIPNTMIITTEAWEHSVQTTHITLASNVPWIYHVPPPAEGFHLKLGIPPLDVLFCNNAALHAGDYGAAKAAMTDCVTIIFDRNNALLTGRKRWMQINQYSHPIDDLAGAVVTARQDSVTRYDDAIAVITET
jgi:hypothetical protein